MLEAVAVADDLGELRVDAIKMSLSGLEVLQLLTPLAVDLLYERECFLGPLSHLADLLTRVTK